MKMKLFNVFGFCMVLIMAVFVSCAGKRANKEGGDMPFSFKATILEINGNDVTVEPLEGEDILRSANRVNFIKANLNDIGASVGDIIVVIYKGGVMESFPARVVALDWSILRE